MRRPEQGLWGSQVAGSAPPGDTFPLLSPVHDLQSFGLDNVRTGWKTMEGGWGRSQLLHSFLCRDMLGLGNIKENMPHLTGDPILRVEELGVTFKQICTG